MTKEKILIVDFENDVHTLLALNLEHHGYDCLSAYDLESAKDIIKNGRPQLVILGYSISAQESSTFLKELNQTAQITHKAPAVLVLGAYSHRKSEINTIGKTQRHVLVKPFSTAQLAHDVNRCLLASA